MQQVFYSWFYCKPTGLDIDDDEDIMSYQNLPNIPDDAMSDSKSLQSAYRYFLKISIYRLRVTQIIIDPKSRKWRYFE